MGISDERKEFIEEYPESVPKRVSFKKGDFIGQKYEVVDILGEGGCGTVYLVYFSRHDHYYALKTFKGEYLVKADSIRYSFFLAIIATNHLYRVKTSIMLYMESHALTTIKQLVNIKAF